MVVSNDLGTPKNSPEHAKKNYPTMPPRRLPNASSNQQRQRNAANSNSTIAAATARPSAPAAGAPRRRQSARRRNTRVASSVERSFGSRSNDSLLPEHERGFVDPLSRERIKYRVWCHECENYTCATTIDSPPPPCCPNCEEQDFLELVDFESTLERHGPFREGPVWSEVTRQFGQEFNEESNHEIDHHDQVLPAREGIGERERQLLHDLFRNLFEERLVNFFDLDDRRFERPLNEKARKEKLRTFKKKSNPSSSARKKRKTNDGGAAKKEKGEAEEAKDNAKDDNDEECNVCLDKMRSGETLTELKPCGHVFHKACVDEWFKTSNNCPVCRCCLDEGQQEANSNDTNNRSNNSRGRTNHHHQQRNNRR